MTNEIASANGRESADVLLDTVGEFSPGSQPRIVRRGDDEFRRAHFAFLPDARRARLLVPLGRSRSAAEAMHKFSSALSLKELVSRSVASLAFRVGSSALLPDRVAVQDTRHETLSDYLGRALGTSVTFTISVGTARANRKPILQIFDRAGRTMAYAKIGDGDVSVADVTREAAALDAIAGKLPDAFDVPTKLHFGSWTGMAVLVISPLRTSARQRPISRLKLPLREMEQLSASFDEGITRLPDAPFFNRALHHIEHLQHPIRRRRLLDLCAAFGDAADGTMVALGGWHGDWTPWNMARSGGRLQLWDWERFERGTPIGFDLNHFLLNTVTRRIGFNSQGVRSAMRAAAAHQPHLTSEVVHLTQVGYLMSLAVRYARSADGPHGSLIEQHAGIVLEAGEDWLRSIQG
jgi:hypothetical protein